MALKVPKVRKLAVEPSPPMNVRFRESDMNARTRNVCPFPAHDDHIYAATTHRQSVC